MYDESLIQNRKDGKLNKVIEDHVLLQFPRRALQIFLGIPIQSANQYVNIGLMLKRTVCRFSSMATNNIVARAPLVAVVGATGTGKSEVSLDNFWCISSPQREISPEKKEPITHLFFLPNSWL
jgi:hypothetical protein